MTAAHAHSHRDENDVVTASPHDAQDLARVVNFVDANISRYRSAPEPQFYLSGADANERVELTHDLFVVLKCAADELSKDRSIRILAREQEISTQQAADLLGLSRPTVVKLIEDDELTATVPGKTAGNSAWLKCSPLRGRRGDRRTATNGQHHAERGRAGIVCALQTTTGRRRPSMPTGAKSRSAK